MSLSSLIESMHLDFGPVDEPLHEGSEPYLFTYAFRDAEPDTLPTEQTFTGWTPFSAAEKAVVREILDEIEGFANVEFREAPGMDDPTIDFGKVDLGSNGRAGPRWGGVDGELRIYDAFAVFRSEIDLSTRPDLLRHEIGHTLGLKHPFENGETLPNRFQNNGFTVMSYTPDPDGEGDGDRYEILDVLALQYLWGASRSSEPRGRIVDLEGLADGAVVVVGPGDGVDAIVAGSTVLAAAIDLRPGTLSTLGGDALAAVAPGASVGTAVGGRGGDRLDGSNAGETFRGGGGSDVIVGRGGADEVRGGAGKDVLYGGRGADALFGGGGSDRIFGGIGFDEVFAGGGADTVFGGGGSDALRGGAGRDVLFGNRGDDALSGGGGADELRGGQGRDALFGGRNDDDLRGGGGGDALWGGTGGDVLRGERGNDLLRGQIGDDLLLGGGGDDVLSGGRGNDVLVGGAGTDAFQFARGGDRDVVRDFGRGDDTVVIRGLGSRSDVLRASEEVDGDVIVDFGRDALILRGTSLEAFEDALTVIG